MTLWLTALAVAGTIEITHQARVLGSDGSPIDGDVSVVVEVCDAASGGTCAEAVSLPGTPVRGGFVTVPVPVETDELLAGDRWVQLTVDDSVLVPRQRLTHVPRAGVAEVVRRLSTATGGVGSTCTEPDGTVVFDLDARAIRVCAGGTWAWIGGRTLIANGASGRSWSDGTYAGSCAEYLNPGSGSLYQGETGNGLYAVDPDGDGTATATYCDMDGGGYTLLLTASASGTTFGNNAPAWSTNTALGTQGESLGSGEFRSTAYGELVTDEVRLCYQDTDHCWTFAHGQGRSLQAFFRDGHSYTQFSLDAVGYSDVGTTQVMNDYLSTIGTQKHSRSVCFWLGINEQRSRSGLGLLGDGSPSGCQPGDGYFDDMAIGLGVHSCYDANGCAIGGSGHLNGRQRGFDNNDNGLVRGPWHVFGR